MSATAGKKRTLAETGADDKGSPTKKSKIEQTSPSARESSLDPNLRKELEAIGTLHI